MKTTEEQRAMWGRLSDAATPGPWQAKEEFECGVPDIVTTEPRQWLATVASKNVGSEDARANAELIASYREAVPLLLQDIATLSHALTEQTAAREKAEQERDAAMKLAEKSVGDGAAMAAVLRQLKPFVHALGDMPESMRAINAALSGSAGDELLAEVSRLREEEAEHHDIQCDLLKQANDYRDRYESLTKAIFAAYGTTAAADPEAALKSVVERKAFACDALVSVAHALGEECGGPDFEPEVFGAKVSALIEALKVADYWMRQDHVRLQDSDVYDAAVEQVNAALASVKS
jgi:hypothetical protein